MSIKSNINKIRNSITENVELVIVSKTRSVEDILEAYGSGQRIFGENKVQEILAKKDFLPPDIEWHFIGHLQSNKVKFVAPFISMIHSVDSIKLLRVLDDEARKADRVIDCLLQFHIAKESSKFGFSLEELKKVLETGILAGFSNVVIRGVMGMATFTNDQEQIRNEFRILNDCFLELKNSYFSDNGSFDQISMGMSDDYMIAIEEGSTMIRVGSSIFGER